VGSKSEGVGLIVPSVQSVSKISNLFVHNPPTLKTDRRTPRDLNTALCTIVHRAVKMINKFLFVSKSSCKCPHRKFQPQTITFYQTLQRV